MKVHAQQQEQQQIALEQHAAPTAPSVSIAPAPAPAPSQDGGDTKKGAWTDEEDSALRHYIEVGEKKRRGRGREGRDSKATEKKKTSATKKKNLKKKIIGIWPAQLDPDLGRDQGEVGQVVQAPLVQPGTEEKRREKEKEKKKRDRSRR